MIDFLPVIITWGASVNFFSRLKTISRLQVDCCRLLQTTAVLHSTYTFSTGTTDTTDTTDNYCSLLQSAEDTPKVC